MEAGLHLGTLTHLSSIGLIELSEMAEFATLAASTKIDPSYFGKVHQLNSKVKRNLSFGRVIFTAAGRELAGISSAEGNTQYEKAALDAWSAVGWKET